MLTKPTCGIYISDQKDARQSNKELVMIITRVLLGNIWHQKGSASYHRPPCMIAGCNQEECYHSEFERYNSVMGTHKDGGVKLNFREFVLFDKDRAYPEYVVKYKRV